MPLTILNVAYPLATVSPHAVGGAEQIVSVLDRAIVAAGHRSLVVACEGSECAGTLLPIPRLRHTLDHHLQPLVHERCRRAIGGALAREPVDVVHLHGVDFHAYLPPSGVPALVTLHMPPAFYTPSAFRIQRPATFLQCVSASQRRACPPGVSLLPEIENGVLTDALAARHGKRRFVLSLGRVCREKGFHLALEAAAKAEMPMLLGGKVFPYAEHERYFRETLLPRLSPTRRFLGPVDFARKRRLLTAARALLVPSLVPETASLVAMEALACGTPVIAFKAGALVDIVEHGVTGFLVDDVDQMADAIHAAAEIDPAVCRATARRRFSAERMLSCYLEVYRALADPCSPEQGYATPPRRGPARESREISAERRTALVPTL